MVRAQEAFPARSVPGRPRNAGGTRKRGLLKNQMLANRQADTNIATEPTPKTHLATGDLVTSSSAWPSAATASHARKIPIIRTARSHPMTMSWEGASPPGLRHIFTPIRMSHNAPAARNGATIKSAITMGPLC